MTLRSFFMFIIWWAVAITAIFAAAAQWGGVQRGEDSPRAKLTVAEVREIRSRLAAGESRRRLGFAYGVSRTTIQRLERRLTWLVV